MAENEYTPTTEEVRERFIDGFPIDTWAVSRDQCGQDFDRWLAAHDAEKDQQIAELTEYREKYGNQMIAAGELLDRIAELEAKIAAVEKALDERPAYKTDGYGGLTLYGEADLVADIRAALTTTGQEQSNG